MKRLMQGVLALAVIGAGLARADDPLAFEYMPGRQCTIGGDLRARWYIIDRDNAPDYLLLSPANIAGPKQQYFRLRERIWGCLELTDDIELQLRVTNEWREWSSAIAEPNNQHDPGGRTWQFPDELVIDNLYLDLNNLFGSPVSLRLGRQDVMLGNGMVVLESSPLDGSRTIGFDGIVASVETESDSLKLMALYNDYKDKWGVINDQNRRLRYGDTGVLGAYWTHGFTPELNTDLYYIYVEIDDDLGEGTGMGALPGLGGDYNAEIHHIGGRLFGNLSNQVKYSAEYCKQLGNYAQNESYSADFSGQMFDARLSLSGGEGTQWTPELTLQYSYFSGEDMTTAPNNDEVEGWVPVFTGYPVWREEIMPGPMSWTNMHRYRGQLVLNLTESLRLTTALDVMYAERGENGTSSTVMGDGGDHIGELFSCFIDYKVTPNLKLILEGCALWRGDYYADGQTTDWYRCQAIYTF